MRIGLTYDLRAEYLAAGYSEEETAEFDRVDTVEGLENAIARLGHEPCRIGNARQLIGRLAGGDRWDLVFNIAEGLHGTARESQVPAILDVYDIPYTFSDPLVTALSLDKGLCKLAVRQAGVPTADFAVVRQPSDAEGVDLAFPLFVKPIAEGTGKGISESSRVETREDLRRECQRQIAQFKQPVLVETFLPGEEFTVGVVGTGVRARVLGVMQVHFTTAVSGIYSYTTKRDYEGLVQYSLRQDDLAARLGELSLSAWRVLDCRDGGRIDFRCGADGGPRFLEVNPLPGLNPEHSDLPILGRLAGVEFDELIRAIVESAQERCRET